VEAGRPNSAYDAHAPRGRSGWEGGRLSRILERQRASGGRVAGGPGARRSSALSFASSIALHASVIGVLAAVSVFPHAEPPAAVRVVIIDADAGGGGRRGPLRGHAPAGEVAGPPAPAAPSEPPAPPPLRSEPERPRIAARPQKETKRPAAPPRAAAEAAKQPRTEPTPGGGAIGGTELALSTGAGDSGGGGGTGGGAGSGSGSGVGSGRGPGVESALASYLRTVRTRLEAVKRYPVLARRRGTEGTATLAIDIRRNGRPAAVRVSGSSGSELLDDEAAEMVDRAAPFAPLPSELDESTLHVVVPVSFDLGG
jgi:TonB family protein